MVFCLECGCFGSSLVVLGCGCPSLGILFVSVWLSIVEWGCLGAWSLEVMLGVVVLGVVVVCLGVWIC